MNLILRYLHANAAKHVPPILRAEMGGEMPADVEEFADIPYDGAGGAPLAADVYRPAHTAPSGLLPVAVMVHGGGLFAGSRKVNRVFCERLAQKGFLTFSLEYRLLDTTDGRGAVSDVCAGFDFVRNALERYGGDPRRVCVTGESAGGFLSLYATALACSETLSQTLGCPRPALRPAALALFSGMLYTTGNGVIGMVYQKDLYGERRRDAAFMERMDPEHPEILDSLPPLLLTSSRGDFLRGHTLRYAEALERAHHPRELLYYPEGKELVHAFPSLDPSRPESGEVLEKLIAWFRALPPAAMNSSPCAMN